MSSQAIHQSFLNIVEQSLEEAQKLMVEKESLKCLRLLYRARTSALGHFRYATKLWRYSGEPSSDDPRPNYGRPLRKLGEAIQAVRACVAGEKDGANAPSVPKSYQREEALVGLA